MKGYPATVMALKLMLLKYEKGERLPYGGNIEKIFAEMIEKEQNKSQPYSIYIAIWRMIEDLNHSVLIRYTRKVMLVDGNYVTPYDFLYLAMKLVNSWDYVY